MYFFSFSPFFFTSYLFPFIFLLLLFTSPPLSILPSISFPLLFPPFYRSPSLSPLFYSLSFSLPSITPLSPFFPLSFPSFSFPSLALCSLLIFYSPCLYNQLSVVANCLQRINRLSISS